MKMQMAYDLNENNIRGYSVIGKSNLIVFVASSFLASTTFAYT